MRMDGAKYKTETNFFATLRVLWWLCTRAPSTMDQSLDDIIKTARKDNATKKGKAAAGKAPGKAPGGKKQRGKGASADGKMQLMNAVNNASKAKRAAKAAKARGMDIEMPMVPSVRPRIKKKAGVAVKMSDTLKARIQSAVSRRGGTVLGKKNASPRGKASTPTKASDIKITIQGGATGRAPGKVAAAMAKAKGRGGKGKGGGRGGGGRGGKGGAIVMPGMAQRVKNTVGAITKKARTVAVVGGRGGRGAGKGGRGRAGLTLAQRFGGGRGGKKR